MANPVTKAILKNLDDLKLIKFVEHWDAVEELVITIFREKSASPESSQEFSQLQTWLIHHYPDWQVLLEPFWRQSRIKGQDDLDDPFLYVLKIDGAGSLVGNWKAMRHLPAAREALNNFLISRTGTGS